MEQANKGKIEGFMTELGRKLDQLLDRARQGAEEAKFSERMEDLRQATDKLENELHEFVKDDEKWREVQVHLKGAALELRKAFESTFTRKQSGTSGGAYTGGTNAGDTNTANATYGSANYGENNAGTAYSASEPQNSATGSQATDSTQQQQQQGNNFEGRNI
ncbi:hypothetical protein [Cesiribacter sp. SM1]|uniref:hypothetical protein n=1 Tax=Cesiribacter sp. SM1 TaxID=2861196 RepID=UPI001CD5EC2E|nr:hypothetical protein [Cesiribacter sp. SM1]